MSLLEDFAPNMHKTHVVRKMINEFFDRGRGSGATFARADKDAEEFLKELRKYLDEEI